MHQSPRRLIVGILGALVLSSALLAAPTASGTEDFALDRVAGADRYATAAQIAPLAFPEGADAAVIARGDDYPDALAGAYLAGVLGGPILLTQTGELPSDTETALTDLGVQTVYLLGGPAAISEDVETALDESYDVVRVAGNDRYGTAAEVAGSQDPAGIGELTEGRTAFLASGRSFADALAAGPLAEAAQHPILLTDPASLPASTKTALDELGIEHVVVLGGTAAVSEAVVTAVKDTGATTQRVAGADRYATAAAIADFALANLSGWSNEGIDLATGEKFADALAAGPAGGELNRSILLTASTSLSKATSDWLAAHSGTIFEGRVFGGTAAIGDSVVTAAETAGSGKTGGAQAGQLTFIDKATDFYRFVPTGATKAVEVTYKTGDTFTVDGASATMGGFETNASPADNVRYTPAAGSTPAKHELTNVSAAAITSGTVGNVDTGTSDGKEFDFINAVSGDALKSDIKWTDGTFKVDGATINEAGFSADINEGDTLQIVGTSFELTNKAVSGPVRDVVVADFPPTTRFKIGALGDEPGASSDGSTDPDGTGNDSDYQANGNPLPEQSDATFSGDVDNYDDFAAQLTAGDIVTYTREAGTQNFDLTNATPTTQKGQAVDDLDTDGSTSPLDTNGGTFTLATEDGTVAVEYGATGTFVVDGRVADEGDFESAYTPGDLISFRPADEPSGTTQRLEITNKALEGAVDPAGVDTANDTYDVLAANGETVLATVDYVGDAGANTYFVNGATATLETFENELNAIAEETKTGTVQVVTAGSVTQHKLTTKAATTA